MTIMGWDEKELDANSSRRVLGWDARMKMAQVQSEASSLMGAQDYKWYSLSNIHDTGKLRL